jgi:ADP-ribose pyrophosphatase YjhB (NUDIX family)
VKFCSECGSPELRSESSAREAGRLDCAACGAVHYRSPTPVVACIAEWHGQVLLCRRDIEPCRGLWGLPGGYVEQSEPIQRAAEREMREEACAVVDDLALYRVYNLPRFNEVVFVFRGSLREGRFGVGDETLEAALFAKRDLPWKELAFESTRAALTDYASQRWQPAQAPAVADLAPAPLPVRPGARGLAVAVGRGPGARFLTADGRR